MDERPGDVTSKGEPGQPAGIGKAGPPRSPFRVQTLIALVACSGALVWAYRSAVDGMRPSTRWAKLLHTGDLDERQIAARQLGDSGPEDIEVAVPTLITAMTDGDERVRAAVASGLGTAGLTAARAKQGREGAKEAALVLTRALADSGAEVRMAAASSLADFVAQPKEVDFPADSVAVSSGIVGLLADPSVMVRSRAQAALSRIASVDPLEPPASLVEGLNSWPLKESREAAAVLLGSFTARPEPTVRALIRALKDKESEVRSDAAMALSKFGGDGAPAVPSLVETLGDPFVPPPPPPPRFPGLMGAPSPGGGGGSGDADDSTTDPASQAARALGRIAKGLAEKEGEPLADAVRALTKALHSDRPALKDAAEEALQRIGKGASAAIPDLIGNLAEACPKDEPGYGTSAASALGEVAPGTGKAAEVIAALTSALGAKESGIRKGSARALAKFGPAASSALTRLRELDKDPERDVARAATEAADKIEGKAPPVPAKGRGRGGPRL